MFRLRLLKLHRRWTVVVWREEPETESVRAFIAGRGKPAKMALRCLEWVTAEGNRKLQTSFEQKAAKVSKENVLRRSEIFIAPHPIRIQPRRSGIYGELGRANIVDICRSYGARANFLRHS